MEDQNYWRKCSVCKHEIAFSHKYYLCSVSSCTKQRAPVQFCSVTCWDSHNAVLNHKSAGADEYTSPSKMQWQAQEGGVRRRIVVSKSSSNDSQNSGEASDDILVVVSKMKAYIKARADMNTSGDVSEVLSDYIRKECDRAIESAKADGRKTVMGRDF